MEPLLHSLIASLDRRAPDRAVLKKIGLADPRRTSNFLVEAIDHPDLGSTSSSWLPSLLLSARAGFAAHSLVELAERYRNTRGRPLELAKIPALPVLLGSSNFLARLLLRHPNWAEDLEGAPPPAPSPEPVEADWTAIRIAKYRGLLRIAARDLLGRPFQESLTELSGLADRCLVAALTCASKATEVKPPALFALGKLGGRELNFSSDVDLLFIYDAPEGKADLERNRALVPFVQTFKRHLEAPSEDGFAYRVDLDLRPEGRSGTLTNSVHAALTYYETFGLDWERQMLIRLRPLGGPTAEAESFARGIKPFVYRRLIDPKAIASVRNMKERIEAERRSAGKDLNADLKEGPGGIRDVEFLVQAMQLFYGGRIHGVRIGNVLDALKALGHHQLLAEGVVEGLHEAYLWLRRAEHCVQLVEERQTHRFPRDAVQRLQLARRMGYREPDAAAAREQLLEDWKRTRRIVRESFDALVLAS